MTLSNHFVFGAFITLHKNLPLAAVQILIPFPCVLNSGPSTASVLFLCFWRPILELWLHIKLFVFEQTLKVIVISTCHTLVLFEPL